MFLTNKKYGFTLVELLVVIAIIALLLSILMPALGKAKEQAKQVMCGANMRQTGLAIMAYSGDYKGKIPPMYIVDAGQTKTTTSFGNQVIRSPYLEQGLSLLVAEVGDARKISTKSYLATSSPLFCPSDNMWRPTRENGIGWAQHPTAANRAYAYMSYTYLYVSSDGSVVPSHPNFYSGFQRYSTNCKGKSVILIDQFPWQGTVGLIPGYDKIWPYYHKNGSNALRLDGSVSFVKKEELIRSQPRDWKQFLTFVDSQ